MTTYDFDCPEDTSAGGNYLEVDCWAHVAIVAVNTSPRDKDGNARQNAIVELTMEVLAATVAGQEKKLVTEIIWGPKLDARDGGAFAKKKIARLALATGLISKGAKGKRISVDFSNLQDRQMIVQFKKSGDEKMYMGIAFADMYHVDDPEKRDVPRDQAAIGSSPGGQEVQPKQSEFDSL